MIFAMTLGRLHLELTRSDLLVRFSARELYWNWGERVGPVFEKVA